MLAGRPVLRLQLAVSFPGPADLNEQRQNRYVLLFSGSLYSRNISPNIFL